jgi:Fe-S cluster assembly iron-binding protein IscA
MVLDEPKDSDEIFKINGFTMLIDKELHTNTKDITVDYVTYGMGSGFRVTSEVPIGGKEGGGCSPSCKCG